MATSFFGPVFSASVPTLENYFGLDIGHEYETQDQQGVSESVIKWQNPYFESAIRPYIPGGSLIFRRNPQLDSWNYDVTVIILSNLDLKNLINCSTVCKSFHSATKADFTWRAQLCKFLPKVEVVASDLCTFSPEQQFKVIYTKIINHCKPYIAKFDRNQEKSLQLLEDIAFLRNKTNKSVIQTARQEAGNSEEGMQKFKTLLNMIVRVTEKQNLLSSLNGANYNGTVESIDPNSSQGQILTAIAILIPQALNDQNRFEEEIQKSESIKNASNGPTIEDVTDAAESL